MTDTATTRLGLGCSKTTIPALVASKKSAQRVPEHVFRARITDMFTGRGLNADHAQYVASTLVDTSLRGVDTHGIRLAPTYARLIDCGKAKASPRIEVKRVSNAVSRMAADCALGPVAGITASHLSMELANEHGIGAVAVEGSNHFGSAGHYAALMARRGAVGLVFSNSDALVAPFAGSQPFFGTNPLAIAAPAENDDVFCLDMATSQTSYSRVMAHQQNGTPLPDGWSLDGTGQPTRDSMASAALLPLGGYKGQGLAAAVQILATLLSGADFDHVLAHALDGRPGKHQSIGHLFISIDIAPLCPLDTFRGRLSSLLAALTGQPKRGRDDIFYAGQQEASSRRDRIANGIPVTHEMLVELEQACNPPSKNETIA